MFVGIYLSCNAYVNARHSISYGCGGVVLWSFCRPIKAISILKSPHRMYVWFGYVVICCVIVCFIIWMYLVSSGCVGIYMFINSHGCKGWFFILIICRYGDMFAGVGILIMFPGYA